MTSTRPPYRVVQWATGGVGRAALDADCVLYAPLLPDPAEVEALLRSGKNVVTPVGWFYPTENVSRLARPTSARRPPVT